MLQTRPDGPLDSAAMARDLHVRPGVGAAALVLQGRGLEILRSRVEQPAMIVVDRGAKTVQAERSASVRATAGQAIALAGRQSVDFRNTITEGAHYAARWLVFDTALLEDAYYRSRAAKTAPPAENPAGAQHVSPVSPGLADACEHARLALAPAAGVPDAVARQRLLEVMHWLLEDGVVLHSAPVHRSVSARLRTLIAARLDGTCTAESLSRAMAMSEATLRRRLAAECTSLTELLVDVRMSAALTLLQATARPVSDIALAVGYESPSRFAMRFRQRFGFAPTAVRRHERPLPFPPSRTPSP